MTKQKILSFYCFENVKKVNFKLYYSYHVEEEKIACLHVTFSDVNIPAKSARPDLGRFGPSRLSEI